MWLSFPQPCGSREFQHLIQTQGKQITRKFKFHSKEANLKRYKQEEPPSYDISKITHTGLYIFAGNTDNLVSRDAVRITSQQLKGKMSSRRKTMEKK